jgi:hypothetical protein
MKQLICLLVSGLFLPMLGEDKPKDACAFAHVEWQDAGLYSKTAGIELSEIDNLTIPVMSVGCVRVMEKSVLVVFHFVDGKPDVYMAIPKQWVIKITPLTSVVETATK